MMKKIGIITLFGYENYGNRLQMYATQKIYEELGFESTVLRINMKKSLKVKMKYLIKKIVNLKEERLKKKRIENFKQHAKNFIKESEEIIDFYQGSKIINKNYDYFSVGSDQIWSKDVAKYRNRNLIFLRFTTKEKRIVYAPSFGHSEIEEKYIPMLREMFEGFSCISIRENEGKKIIEKIINKKIEVLLDPTMSIDRVIWENFAKKHKYRPEKKYILTYFLGKPCKKVEDILENYKKEYEIIKLNDIRFGKYYDVNPSEWVDYINNTSLFLTDSFHGVVFSLIFKKPFSVYERIGGNSMNSRIKTILNKFNVENRWNLSKENNILFSKPSNIDKILKKEKDKTFKFLKKSLGIKDE